jgi:hypothetical protein
VKTGRNVVAVRIFSNMYAGGFIGYAGQMHLGLAGSKSDDAIPLVGEGFPATPFKTDDWPWITQPK